MNTNHRFVRLNSRALRQRRLRLGLTQRDLARAAGYSERLVRKAESDGLLNAETAQHIAEALSTATEPISLSDLVLDGVCVARLFVEAYDRWGRDMLRFCDHYFADDFVWNCAGDPRITPFAGSWTGISGMQEWLNIFFATFTRNPGSLTSSFTAGLNSVAARYVDCLHLKGRSLAAVWVNLHFQFNDGLIARIDDEYDTKTVADALLEDPEFTHPTVPPACRSKL